MALKNKIIKKAAKKIIKKTAAKKQDKTVKKSANKKASAENKNQIKNILLVGVGGQGIILASEILSKAIMLANYDVKKSEIHGMSQRGGSVNSHIRYGKKVYSPTMREKTADIILALEKLEALREIDYLAENGILIVNEEEIMPSTVEIGLAVYPENIDSLLREAAPRMRMIEAQEIAKELKAPKVFNTILLGVLSRYMPEISIENWRKAIKESVKPEVYDINMRAFTRGMDL